jgi:hypothetical protein
MAGGMTRKGDRVTLADRIHGTPASSTGQPSVKPCVVTDRHGRLPGLLLEWRRTSAGWEGRVVRPVLDISGRWAVVEDWIPAPLLEPG